MIRLAGPLCLASAAGAALFLFQVKYEVRALEDELAQTHRAILDHQEAIQVLRTEWSYLNQPARIADLASRHLGLRPIRASQVIRLEDLPRRAARQAGAAAPGSPDPTKVKGGTARANPEGNHR